MMQHDITCLWQTPAMLGEGPLWVARENAVYWLDIMNKKVHRYHLTDGAKKSWHVEAGVTSLAERKQGGFVCTIRDGFAFIDLNTGVIDPIALPETHIAGNRFNDGKIDAQGRYWSGSMDEGEKLETGRLYRLDVDLSLHTMDSGYCITNGPTFSPDGNTLYHNETMTRTLYAFDCDRAGGISNKRVFKKLVEEAEGYPDGMTVDSEGCLWQCHFFGARITRYSPQGEVLQVVPMPVPNVTSCTFAGPNLDTLYITTARLHLSEDMLQQYPLAGSLFSYKPGVTGLPTPQFAG